MKMNTVRRHLRGALGSVRKIPESVRPYFPNPDTPDNHVAINVLGFGLAPAVVQNATGIVAHRRSPSQSLRRREMRKET